jgi:3-oxoacyl-[acyl-carrier-protein] synthase II
MRQPLYIHAATAISAQYSFDNGVFLQPVVSSCNNKLHAVDADYRAYINPVAIRRMSRTLKITISAAMKCLKDAGVSCPDAIITGTGRGSVGDMEFFLKDMIRQKEEALNPTPFIQSTYNAPNGWIALQSKSVGYNETFVHRGCSLELALIDAQLLLAETGAEKNVLVGCYDELSDEYYIVKDKLGYWKEIPVDSAALLHENNTTGSVAGEGSSFFLVSGEQKDSLSSILQIAIIHEPTAASLQQKTGDMLSENGLSWEDIDVVLCGKNGDSRFESLYENIFSSVTGHTAITGFKHLSGEYETANGFAIWLTQQLFRNQSIPQEIILRPGSVEDIRNILLVNHDIHDSATVMLLQKS